MAEILLQIGGRTHAVACRDGEEDRVRKLGQFIAERWPAAQRAAGASTERAMFFVALMLADDLDEAQSKPPEGAAMSESALVRVADRLERLADALEQSPANA